MILALLVITGLASHDGAYVTQKEEPSNLEKEELVVVLKDSNRPK